MPISEIERILISKADWVQRHQQRIQSRPPGVDAPRQYISGETFRYLGRDITLQVEESPRERIWLHDDRLIARLRHPSDSAHTEAIVEGWFDNEAKRCFKERFPVCVEHARAVINIPQPKHLTIRRMKSRWGSCSARRRITLNIALITVAPELIDYVILHELCHLIELNHSAAFYALMAKVVPDWKQKRKRLRGMSVD